MGKLYAVFDPTLRTHVIQTTEPSNIGELRAVNVQIPNGMPLIQTLSSVLAVASQIQTLGDPAALVVICIEFV